MKVLPTVYNGRKYRSRTEARWAVFLDQLRVRFEYEAEGYDLGDFYYLPDFWLPDLKCFMEIKGMEPTADECAKASLLAEFTKKDVYVFFGGPDLPWATDKNIAESAWFFPPSGGQDNQHWFCECQTCHRIDIQFNGLADRMRCHPGERKDYQPDSPRLKAAYEVASKYEFWSPPGGAK